jgi:hypothetical protein
MYDLDENVKDRQEGEKYIAILAAAYEKFFKKFMATPEGTAKLQDILKKKLSHW